MESTESQNPNWFSTGFSGINREEERLASALKPSRIWIPRGKKKELIFLDDEPCAFHDHQYHDNNSWKNWMTCARPLDDNALCCSKLPPRSRNWVGYFTVIDCSQWQDRQGNNHQYELSFFRAPISTMKQLEAVKQEHGALSGALFAVSRVGEKSPGVGDTFIFKKFVDLSQLLDLAAFRGKKIKDIVSLANANDKEANLYRKRFQAEQGSDGKFPLEIRPFNYAELLKPKTQKEMKEILGAYKAPASGANNDGPVEADDSDVPF